MSKNNGAVNIFEEGILVDITIGRWGAKQKLKAGDLGLNGEDLPEIFYLGHKKMIHHSNFKEINTVANEAGIYLNKHSIPFPIHGVRFLPKKMVGEVIDSLDGFKKKYDDLVDEFISTRYDLAVDEIKKEFPDEWESMKFSYPTKTELKGKYRFDYQVYQLTLPDAKMGILSKEEIVLQRKKINRQVEEFAEMYGAVLRQEITKIAGNLQNNFLKEKVIFKQNSIDNILNMCDRFESGLNFLNDKTVTKVIKELKEMFKDTDAKDIRSDSELMGQINGQLRAIVDKVSDVNDYKAAVLSNKRRLVFK